MDSKVETLFTGGSVLLPGSKQPSPSGVAVAGGRIAAIGTDAELAELAGPGTEVVDLAGGLLLPGFQDAHVHPVMGGLTMLQCDLHAADTAEECYDAVADYAAAHPDAEWITGGGWAMSSFENGCPSRQALDALVPDRPAFLTNRDGHSYWVNTKALELAGLDAATPDPADGRIEREPDGFPAGTLHEGAGPLVNRLLPQSTPEDMYRALMAGQELLLSLGITAWQDAAVGRLFGFQDIYDVYLRAAGSGDLKARVVGALWWERDRGAEQVPELVARRADGQVGRFAATSVKIMQDGVAESFTAGMLEPYLDHHGCATDNSGLSFVDPVALQHHVTELDAAGFQVHFHALGDRAVREVLDALEAARTANGPGDNRHHLAHLQVVHPDDVHRFKALDAVANIQPFWAAHQPQMDELTIPFLGDDRAARQYPFGDLLRAGAHLAAGSDWSVSSPDPLAGIHVAVNRAEPGSTERPLNPHNALTVGSAVHAYTRGSAYANHLDDRTGRIQVGYLADLAVLDSDVFGMPTDEISRAKVVATYVEGERVYSSGS